MDSSCFEQISNIYKGQFSKISLVKHSKSGKKFVLKIFNKKQEQSKFRAEVEEYFLKLLKHPFILEIQSSFSDQKHVYLVLEYLSEGCLFEKLNFGKLTENAAKFYLSEIVLAVGFIHQNGCIYSDLKLENVMLDVQGHIKLIDMEFVVKSDYGDNFVGSIACMAPEIMRTLYAYVVYGKTVDWWSLGILAFELVHNRKPHKNVKDENQIMETVLNAKSDWVTSELDDGLSSDIKDLIVRLLEPDTKKRLGALNDYEEIFQHSFFEGLKPQDVLDNRIKFTV